MEKKNTQNTPFESMAKTASEKKITLMKPLHFEGKEYTELEFDLDLLTGNDICSVEREFRIMTVGVPLANPVMSPEYQALVLAIAAHQPVELIKALPAPEFIKATVLVQNFLANLL